MQEPPTVPYVIQHSLTRELDIVILPALVFHLKLHYTLAANDKGWFLDSRNQACCERSVAKRALSWPTKITPVYLLVTALEIESANVQTAGEEVPEGDTVKWCNWCRHCCYNVKKCRELEERFRTHFTEKISSGDADQINMQEVKKVTGQLDRKRGLTNLKRKLHRLPWYRRRRVAETVDIVLDLGEQHIRGLQDC